MPKQITNAFYIDLLSQQARCAGMPQGMRAMMPQFRRYGFKALAHNLPKSAVTERPIRHIQRQENLASCRTWPRALEVADKRISNRINQGIFLSATAFFGAAQVNAVLLPIDIIEGKLPHLRGTKPIDREEKDDGAITDELRITASQTSQQPYHLGPGRATWWHSGLVNAGWIDRSGNPFFAPALVFGVIEEAPHVMSIIMNRDALKVSAPNLVRQKTINGAGIDFPESELLGVDPQQESLDKEPARSNSVECQVALRPQVLDELLDFVRIGNARQLQSVEESKPRSRYQNKVAAASQVSFQRRSMPTSLPAIGGSLDLLLCDSNRPFSAKRFNDRQEISRIVLQQIFGSAAYPETLEELLTLGKQRSR